MTVEEIRGSSGVESDEFPKGMRVLAVDDDPTCLRLLDGLLRKCQYHVTTTSQAKAALKLLRENKDKFDVVISDVHMPDMDGFKLLELVGLEMDLPVIMLSANSDTKLVMKGITHGACDYLVKPVRLEELRNIWQHVIRRKNKSSTKDQKEEVNRKRKGEEEESEENGNDDDDTGTQKKPRVVWSMELHRKFVAAVNHLGLEKAVPKRILDLMNVEGISRENVASHLQKYRNYLKRISSMAAQQADMVAAFGGWESSYSGRSSLDGHGDFRTLSGRGRLSNSALSYQTGPVLGKLNSPSGVSLRSLSSSAFIQPCHSQNLDNSVANLGRLQPVVSPANRNPILFQGTQTPLELQQLQQYKGPVSSSNNSLTGASSHSMILQRNPQQTQIGGVFGNPSSFKVTSIDTEPFNTGVNGSNLLYDGRCTENLQNMIQLSSYSSNRLLLPNSIRLDNSSTGSGIHSSTLNVSPTNTVSASLDDSRGEIHSHTGLISDAFRSMNQETYHRWGEHSTQNSNHISNAKNPIVPTNGVIAPLRQSLDQNGGECNVKFDASLVGQANSSASTLPLSDIDNSNVDSEMRSDKNYLLEQTGFDHNGYDSLEDLMNEMIKQEQDETMSMNGQFGFNAYSFGSCS